MEIAENSSKPREPISMVADAAVVIVVEKLRVLQLVEEDCVTLKGQAKHAISKLQQLYRFLEDEFLKESHPEWMHRLLQSLYQAEDQLDIFLFRVVNWERYPLRLVVPGVLARLMSKGLLCQRMKKFIHEVDGLLQDQHLDHGQVAVGRRVEHLESGRQFYERWRVINDADQEDPAEIKKENTYIDEVCKEVTNRLLNTTHQNLYCRAVYGGEGLGKKFLARWIYRRKVVKDHFDCRAWVHVSSAMEVKDIGYAVLKQVKDSKIVLKKAEHMGPDEVKQALLKELGNKRYLVVLDDLPDTSTWDNFKSYIPDSSNGSRVLVTTQDKATMPAVANLEWTELKTLTKFGINQLTYTNQVCEEVTHCLLDGGNPYLSKAMYGDEGSGKTYLVRKIYNQTIVKKHFKRRAWVYVSGGMEVKDIGYAVLKQVKDSKNVLKNAEHMGQDDVKQALLKELGNKRYLVVLDDLQNSSNTWYSFISYIPDLSNGSRVLVTTRDRHTAFTVESSGPTELENLPEDETVLLFHKKVDQPVQDQQLIRNMISATKGLPLTICLLGGLLMKLHSKEWPEVIEKVSFPDILAMSYNKLPPEERPCFLYLTLFPKATPIPVRRILRLWLGEELLMKEYYEGPHMDPEDRGEKYLEDLIMRNLVEVVSWKPDGTPGACQVVTSLYDKFCAQAVDLGLLHIHSRKCNDNEPSQTALFKMRQFNIRWLAEHSNISSFPLSEPYHLSHMRSFISFCNRKGIITNDLGTFLRAVAPHRHCQLLRVLDLEGVYKPSLHRVIGKLVLLKYLGLRSTVLDALPESVGDLPQLETLDIKHTNVTVLPVSLWKSDSLRHLYLNGFHVDPAVLRRSTGPRSLSKLRTLSGLYVSNIEDSLGKGLMMSLTSLTKLGIHSSWSDKPNNVNEWLSNVNQWLFKLTKLQSLKLGMIQKDKASEATLPSLSYLPEYRNLFHLYLLGKLVKLEANQLPSCLRVLTLSQSGMSADPMHILGKLPNLRTLRLLSNSFTGKEMVCSSKGFPQLRVLKLWNLTKLEKLTLEENCLVRLKELELRGCDMLKFKEISRLENLASLEVLSLIRMHQNFAQDTEIKNWKESGKDRCVFKFPSKPIEEGQIWPAAQQAGDPVLSRHKDQQQPLAPSSTSTAPKDGDQALSSHKDQQHPSPPPLDQVHTANTGGLEAAGPNPFQFHV